MRKRVIQILLSLCCAVMALVLPITASVVGANAVAANDGGKTSKLTVHFEKEGKPLSGYTFYLYKVGENGTENSGGYDYTATTDFSDADVSLSDLNFGTGGADSLRDMANKLIAYIRGKGGMIQPAEIGYTDANGNLNFDGLEPGLYLVCGPTKNGVTPQAVLIPLPYPNPEGDLSYELTAEVKPDAPKKDTITIEVVKVWSPAVGDHPDVTVQLYRDSEEYEEVTLNAANGWKHSWEGLEPGHTWKVKEKGVPDGYTATVSPSSLENLTEDGVFTITNKRDENHSPDPSGSPDPSNSPDPSGSPDPSNSPDSSGSPESSSSPDPSAPPDDEPKLPQTGQLWWPVPLLFVGGLVLFSVGMLLTRSKHNKAGVPDEDGADGE